jgi:hypothetical protein
MKQMVKNEKLELRVKIYEMETLVSNNSVYYEESDKRKKEFMNIKKK